MRRALHIPPSLEYSNIITEMGVCHSSTELISIQKPYRANKSNRSVPQRVPDNTLYSSVDIMRLIITPHSLDTGNVTIVGIIGQWIVHSPPPPFFISSLSQMSDTLK